MKDFLSKLIEKDIHIDLVEGGLSIKFPKKEIDQTILQCIKDRKQQIIDYLNLQKTSGFVEIPVISLQDSYPISDAQRRLWVLSQFEGGSVAYNMPGHTYLSHDIEIEHFRRAIDATIDRHEILRTVFLKDESGEIRQYVKERKDLGFFINYKDLRKETNKEEKAEAYIDTDATQPFNLERGPLMRAALLQVQEKGYVFYFNMHHIISDGWSTGVLSKDILKYYEAYQACKAPELKELRIQYKDYSGWQLAQLNGDSFKAHKKYWLEKLSGELPLLDLPSTKQRPKVVTYNGHSLATYLDKRTATRLKAYVQQNGGSLFMGLLASWNVLMYRYTSQTDIIIGTPVAGRGHADLEDQIGFYVNTLALRNEINPEASFDNFYQALKENTLNSYSHYMYPFDRLVEELELHRDTGRSAVFDVMLTLQNNGERIQGVELSEEELNHTIDQGYSRSKFDLEVTAQEVGDYLSLNVVFNPDVYEKAMVEGLIGHHKQLLTALLENPRTKISQVDYLSEEEKHKLLVTFNDTKVAYPKDKTIVDLFEEQAAKTPDTIAVVFEDRELTYRELNEKSSQLARYLRDNYDIQPDDLVGIKQERSEWMIVSILGVLKSGGAYVPVDPAYPQERVQAIVEDSKCKVLLGIEELARFRKSQGEYSVEQARTAAESNNLAYVIYTSGSTGKPKGVMIEHRNVTNFFSGMTTIFGEEKGTFLSMTNFTFDISVLELLWTLSKGYKVVIQGEARQIVEDENNYSVYSQIKKHKVTHLQITPSMGAMLNQHLSEDEGWGSIKKILLGGEPATASLVNGIYQKLPHTQLYNMYGPTETTIWSTVKALEKNTQNIEIGKPIANTKIYILDENRYPVAAGVQGEIYIGGEGVARGYTNKELTDLSFIESPFVPGDRLYRTGDFGSWLTHGSIYCFGRKDQQVKIRGYRIELGEIERALLRNQQINEAVVLAKENKSGEKELVAYITSGADQNTSDLRAYLKETLPVYMVPAYFVQLESMPLTANGKVDKKILPNPEGLGLTIGVEYVAPRNEQEAKLVKIWEEVLQREKIGVLDDFFALGGHSLKAVRLSNEYQKELGVKLALKDLFAHTSVASHAALIASSSRDAFVQIEKVTPQASYPISDGQRRLWVLSLFEGGSVAYNMPDHTYLNQDIEIENLKRAIDATIQRHEILRTVFRGDESGEIRQWVLERKALGFTIDYQDFRKEVNKKAKAEAYIAADANLPFDLEKGPLLRAALLQVEEEGYVFYFSMHHIISDGWSMEVLSKDVFKYYEAYRAGKEPEVKELRIQYKDYSAWQLAQLNGDSFRAHKEYWLDKLSGELPLLDLPSTKQRPKVMTYNGQGLAIYLDKATTAKLKGYVQHNGGSLFMVLLASWNVLMYRYTSQTDIIIGTPVAGRDHADLEDQIGFYVNTLALRNEINPEASFDNFYQALKENTIESYNHQMYPFDRLVEELNLQRDTSRGAVFDVMLTLQNNDERIQAVELSEEELNQTIDQGYSTSKFDLEVTAQEVGDYLSLNVVFNPDVYEKTMVEGLIGHHKQLLTALLENPRTKISQVDYLSEEEKHKLLVAFNDTAVAYPKDKTIVDLFEEQAAKRPDNVAVVFEDRELTYRELDEKSNHLGHYLMDNYDIHPDDLIGIKQERSDWMIVSMLAVLKSGGAYVPIDPEYPEDRIDFMIRDSQCKVVVDEEELLRFEQQREQYPSTNRVACPASHDLAYVIYTSGTTGRPKGVMIEHHSMADYALTFMTTFELNEKDKIIHQSSISFDTHVEEIYPTLLSGATLLLGKHGGRDVEELTNLIEDKEATILSATPLILQELDSLRSDLSGLRLLISGGDKFSTSYVSNYLGKIPIYDTYGPSESTVCTTYFKIDAEEKRAIIGRPITNRSVYTLGDHNELQPTGVIGEICIGGSGLSRGYLNQPTLTKEKFIDHPFKAGERLYKTGDLGRWLPDGNIEFIGRRDDQVKIRGYRIELGEIQHALLKHEAVDQAVVLARATESGEKELVAYITSNAEQNTIDLRGYLKDKLPAYMVPAYFVQLESMPLTANGKVDKKSLPNPEGLGLTSGVEYVAPRNELEAKLVKIWEEVLQREKIGMNDDFFALGGHSLKAVRLSNEYQKQLAVKLALKDLFAHTSIASHVVLIESSIREAFVQIERVILQASYPISDAQRRLWVLSQFEGGSVAYNMPDHTYLNPDVEIENFKRAIDATIERHEILRTVFREDESGEIRQWVLERKALGFTIDYQDFRKEANKKEKAKAYIAADAYQPFDLEKGPLLRAALLQVEEKEYVFYFNMHHIISDGWSVEVLSEDVFKYYEAFQLGKDAGLKELRIQYKDYSAWQLAQLNGDSFKAHKEYWLDKLSGELPLLELPGFKQRPKVMTYNGHSLVTYLDKATTAKLKGYVQGNGGSLFMGLLASWNVLMYRYTSQTDIIIGTPVAGRDHADLEDQIGFYVNTLALRNEVNPEESFDNFYQALKENTIESYNHQMYPFDRLVEELNLQRDTSRGAVFDVMLTLQNNGERIQGVELSEEELNHTIDQGYSRSKFDLEVTAQEVGDYLSLNVVFNPDVYEKVMVEGLIRHYKQLLEALLETTEEKISLIDYLSEDERQKLLVTFNETAVAYPKDKTIVDLFEEQAAKRPDNIAVVFEDRELTYRELNERSNQLAHYLRDNYDIRPDDLVGIKQGRSEWVIISILGVLKSGGAYVPIDPEYPQERIEYMEEDTQCKVCLDGTELSKFKENQGRYSKKPIASNAKEHHLAYVIYTSGSTGKPKGVMIEHKSLSNLCAWHQQEYSVDSSSRATLFSGVGFDASVWELFPYITCGGSVYPIPDEQRSNATGLVEVFNKFKITHAYLPTILYKDFVANGEDLTQEIKLCVGGEALLYYKKVEKIKLFNNYGPTENTVVTTNYRLAEERSGTIPIGKPISNTQVYILSKKEELQPIGVIGEICTSGLSLARGYLNQPELTQEKFIANPFKEGERLYRTGDLGRWLSDGNIEFIGRKDNQVKIRGYRIELGEIEHALSQVEGIKHACVLAKERTTGVGNTKYLMGYYELDRQVDLKQSTILEKLSLILPEYMLPSALIEMQVFPLTINGKLNRLALPDPDFISSEEYVAPTTETEIVLVKIWQDVLGVERVGVNDNFFLIGGNSILAIQASHRMRIALGVDVKVADVFRLKSIQKISLEKDFSGVKLYQPSYNSNLADLIFVPPGRAGSEMYQGLADLLKAKYNCIGIDNYNIHNKEKISSLNELAKHYLLEYERKWSLKEPIYLLGWSLGGQIALEMAAILEGRNYKEIHIFLLDTVIVDKYTVTNSRQEIDRIIQTRNEMREKYEKGYVESVISSMEAENKLASTKISSYLKCTNVTLFKANAAEIIAKFNNVDRVAERVEVINLDCSHLEIVEAEALTIANYLLSKLHRDSA